MQTRSDQRRLREVLARLDQDVVEGAVALLGLTLARGDLRARIVEVEAYRAENDPACHAFRGMTPRNAVMFQRAGLAYVYFNYGVHWMLNVTAHAHGLAAAVLIRAAQPLAGLETMRARRPHARRDEDLLSGPGKLAAAFAIDRRDYGLDLFLPARPDDLRLEWGPEVERVASGPRIGIRHATEFPWRFVDADRIRFASKPHPPLAR